MDSPHLPFTAPRTAPVVVADPRAERRRTTSGARALLALVILPAPGLWVAADSWQAAPIALSLPILVAAGLLLARTAQRLGAAVALCDASVCLLAALPGWQRWRWARLEDLDLAPYVAQDELFDVMLQQATASTAAVGGLLLCAGLGVALLGVGGVGPRALIAAGIAGLLSALCHAAAMRLPPESGAHLLALAGAAWVLPALAGLPSLWTQRRGRMATLVGATVVLVLMQATRSPLTAVAANLPSVLVPGRAALPRALPITPLTSAPFVLPDADLAAHLAAAGFPRARRPVTLPLTQAGEQWSRAPRNVVAIAAPADLPLDALFAHLRVVAQHGVLRVLLVGRAPPLRGPFGQAFSWPTVSLLLDAPPNDAGWARLDAQGLQWEVEPLAVSAIQEPVCGLHVGTGLTTGVLHATLERLVKRKGSPCFEGVAVVLEPGP